MLERRHPIEDLALYEDLNLLALELMRRKPHPNRRRGSLDGDIAPINAVFTSDTEQIERARRIIGRCCHFR